MGGAHANFFAGTCVNGFEAALKFTRCYPYECSAVAVIRIHIGLKLKDKSAEWLIQRYIFTLYVFVGLRCGSQVLEVVQKHVKAKIVKGRTEENRRYFAPCKCIGIHIPEHIFNEHYLFSKLLFFSI